VDGYSDASGSDNSELVVPRTALATMEMNGLERLVIWNNLYIRVTLKSVQGKNRSMKGKKKPYPESPGEVDFENDVLMAGRDRRGVGKTE
jgi:hypothetical protein